MLGQKNLSEKLEKIFSSSLNQFQHLNFYIHKQELLCSQKRGFPRSMNTLKLSSNLFINPLTECYQNGSPAFKNVSSQQQIPKASITIMIKAK